MIGDFSRQSGVSGVRDVALIIVLALFLIGAPAHIVWSQFSVVNIVSVLSIVLFARVILRAKLGILEWALVSAFLLYIVCSIISVFYSFNEENIRVLRGAVVASVSVALGGASSLKARCGLIDTALNCVLIIAIIVCTLQLSYIFVGVGLDPAINDQFVQSEDSDGIEIGIRSFFTNPNDLSVFGALCLLYFALRQPSMWSVSVLMACVLIVLGGSRAAMVVAIIVTLALSVPRLAQVAPVLALVAFAVVQAGFFTPVDKLYAIDRIGDLIQIFTEGVAADGSASVRFNSFAYFLTHYSLFLVPSFDASVPFHAYSQADFDYGLVAMSPHNFLIELHGLFGAAGLVIFLTLAFVGLYRLVIRFRWFIGILVFVGVCALSLVPSSLVNFHQFFFIAAAISRPLVRTLPPCARI